MACARAGGTLPGALNAAGEVAVRAFLSGQIKFTDIVKVTARAAEAEGGEAVTSYAQLCEVDARARLAAKGAIAALGNN